jgi:hypothetical protein
MIWDKMPWYLTILSLCGLFLMIYGFTCVIYHKIYSQILIEKNINPIVLITIGIAFFGLALSWNSIMKK